MPSPLRRTGLVLACALAFVAVFPTASADEGQWPLSMLEKLKLGSKGLQISVDEIWNPESESMVDAICRVNGATGSFVSPQGLILTNHHVAFDGVASVSTPEKDWLTEGFVARERSDELPARGYTCRITESYQDVSAEILGALRPEMQPGERTATIARSIEAIVARTEKDRPGIRAEVAEMFQGESWFLFVYRDITDVRLVCVPPRAVGEYGGETDNWVWPRHTGDFAFLRAYVGPDGTPAPYSPDNVPYVPRRHLEVNPVGVDAGEFVFLLGYPGRTYRHQSAAFLAFEKNTRMPFFVERFQHEIGVMEEVAAGDPAAALKLATEIKWRANVEKNYRGKLLGMQRLSLVDEKAAEDAKLAAWIAEDPERAKRYEGMLAGIAEVYDASRVDAPRDLLLSRILRTTTLLQLALDVVRTVEARERAESGGDAERARRIEAAAVERRERLLKDAVFAVDRRLLITDLEAALALEGDLALPAVRTWLEGRLEEGETAADLDAVLGRALEATKLTSAEGLQAALALDREGLRASDDPFITLVAALAPAIQDAETRARERAGRLNELMGRYVEARRAFLRADFVPDANSTLRLTYGRIRGYEPRDGVVYHPFTTVEGILEKATGEEPFDPPARLVDLIRGGDFGRWRDGELKSIPVAMLYDCDTTGGNSGSPVLDSEGRVVGVNFDRAFEATINDFRWSQDYSRSIGVDIRYVLFITEKLMGAANVIEELSI